MLGAVSCGFCCSFTDVAPRFSALLNTIANTCGALAGMLGPILVAAVTTSRGSDGRGVLFILVVKVVCDR